VEFDFIETGGLPVYWIIFIVTPLLGLGWRLFIGFLESRRAWIPWRRIQYWWPTAMLVWGWIVAALVVRNECSEWLCDAFVSVFGVLNLPVLLVVAAVFGVLQQAGSWERLLAGSVAMWGTWHLLLRLAEWRAWINAPISVHNAGSDSRSISDESPGGLRRFWR